MGLQVVNESYGMELWRCGEPLDSSPTEESHKTPLSIFCFFVRKKSFLNSVKQWIKFDNVFVVDPVGLAGGLAMLWKQELKVKKVLFTNFTI